MPITYEKLGIHFLYPDNWTLDEAEAAVQQDSVTVQSPGGAFWTLVLHSATSDPAELVKGALEAMQQEYDELDVRHFRERMGSLEVVGCEMNFYCLDLTSTAVVRSFRTPATTYVIFCQADDREYETAESVFAAITTSLVSGLQTGR